MVMRPDVWGDRARRRARRRAPTCWCRRRRGSRSRSGPPRRSPARATSSWRAAGTRASTRASPSTTAARPDVTVTEFSIGDYVLNGGEVAALVVVEAVGRLLPGVVGNPESLVEESHGAAGLLEYPVYTKPPGVGGARGPRGAAVRAPREDRALAAGHARCERTAARRPDLVAALPLDQLDAHDLARARRARLAAGRRAPGPRSSITWRSGPVWQTCPLVRAGCVSATGETINGHPSLSTRTRTTMSPRTPLLPSRADRDVPTTLLTCGRARK